MSAVPKKVFVKFAPKGEPSFYDAVRANVAAYFEDNHIPEHGNRKMYIKTAAMLSMYFLPLVAICTGVVAGHLLLFYALWLLMGAGLVGIGVAVMHDSNHGSYATSKRVNNMLGNLLNVVGGYSVNWRIQHNILHHTYTNLNGLDEDIEAGMLLRMSPHRPWFRFHKYQHIYAGGLYLLMNLFWVVAKDYRQLVRYDQQDLLKKEKITLRKAIIELSVLKVFYLAYILAVPMLFSGFAPLQVLLGFVMMHLVAGLSLALIFQPAHVMETSEFPDTPDDRKMENNWAVHQLLNTTNFCPDNKFVSWYIGGLNFQIEHHLFPHICHVHYPKLAPIVQRTAEEFGLSYQIIPTFRKAILDHFRMLKKLGASEIVTLDPAPVTIPAKPRRKRVSEFA